MPINAGIDWLKIMQGDQVSKIIFTPFMEEAGSCLVAAARLWQGSFGQGRVLGNELEKVGRRLFSEAASMKRSSLGWIDHSIDAEDLPFPENHTTPPEGPRVGHLISEASAQCDYQPQEDENPKNRQAVYRLTKVAVLLIDDVLSLAGKQGEEIEAMDGPSGGAEYKREKFIANLEDEFEGLMDVRARQCFCEPVPSLSFLEIDAIRACAIMRSCVNLAGIQANISSKRYQGFVIEDKELLKVSNWGINWWRQQENFKKHYTEFYRIFAEGRESGADTEVTGALMATMNRADSFNQSCSPGDTEEIKRSEILILHFIDIFLNLLPGGFREKVEFKTYRQSKNSNRLKGRQMARLR